MRSGLRRHREVAATTVATMLKVMLEKGLVRREEGPRGYLWSAAIPENQVHRGLLGKLLDDAFDGSASRLVAHMLEDGRLSDTEREAIRGLFEDYDAGERRPRGKRGRTDRGGGGR